jgi:hypothetical protein
MKMFGGFLILSFRSVQYVICFLQPPAHEDETDRGFRNVGYYNQDAGELPKRKHITCSEELK